MNTARVAPISSAATGGTDLPQALSAPPSLFIDTQSIGLRAQTQQFLDSYLRVMGRLPTVDEITAFERRQLEQAKGG